MTEDNTEILTMDVHATEERVIKANLADPDHDDYVDYEMLNVDKSGGDDQKHVKVKWVTLEEVDKPLREDEIVIPEGYDYGDVRFDDKHPEVLGIITTGTNEWGEANEKKFNPQNGRWYDYDPYPDIDRTSIAGGLETNCAYEDCSGTDSVQVEGDIKRPCPDCGEPLMGRKQFQSSSKRKRSNRSHIASKTKELGDEFAAEMKRLKDHGVGTVPAMDYLMCSVGDTTIDEWAEARGVQKYTVRVNMREVAQKVGEEVTFSVKK